MQLSLGSAASRRRSGRRLVYLAGLLALLLPAAAGAQELDPATIAAQIAGAKLDLERAVHVSSVALKAGFGTLRLDEGVLVPTSPVAGKPVELAFMGRGRIAVDPPDEIEAGQLELFTGARRFEHRFENAVFVIGQDAAVAALLGRPPANLDDAEKELAGDLFTAWRDRRERRLLDIDRAILLDALGEPFFKDYFAVWVRGGDLDGLLYAVEPGAPEQVTLGRFVVLDATEKERRSIAKDIRQEQKKGRLVGLEVDDLGQWDTWLSAPTRLADGRSVPGTAAFEPLHYKLDVRLAEKAASLSVTAHLELDPVIPGSRGVLLTLPPDFTVTSVKDGAGQPLYFARRERDLTVVLPAPAVMGTIVPVTVEYSGNAVEKDGRLFTLLSTMGWYPHAGTRDRASYELTFHWPAALDLVASGRRVDGGVDGGARWERREVREATQGVSFEVGHYRLETETVGHVTVTFAFGSGSTLTGSELRATVKKTVGDALRYYEGVFGPYPLDYLTVATASRSYSQSLLGFVTLSDATFAPYGFWAQLLGVADRRAVIAHELAHQWWGDEVGWVGYRDQWISEAMANYSAGLFSREVLKEPKIGMSTTARWRDDLTMRLADGRPLESVGPVVLGQRLMSSRAGDAYTAIVYKKGALVLDMLARVVGEKVFPQALGQVARAARGKEISSADLLAMLTRVTGVDLTEIGRHYVFSTGVPEVFFDYRFERSKETGWVASGTVRRESPLLFHYRVARTAGSGWDVVREARPQIPGELEASAIPIEFALLDAKKPKGKGPEGTNTSMRGNLNLRGSETPFTVGMDAEPRRMRVDPDDRALAVVFDDVRSPTRSAFVHGGKSAALGRFAEAESWFAKALSSEDAPPDSTEGLYYDQIQTARRIFRGRVELQRARLALDQSHDAEAEQALGRVGSAIDDDDEESRVLRARLEVHRGDYERAFKRLRKAVVEHGYEDAETASLFAIAAQRLGRDEDLGKARKLALACGVDLSELDKAAPVKPSS